MIVQPDFIDHWKTRLLVDMTKDPSAPLVILRLWGYCQTSKKSYFPDMTPVQLASICRWGDRKPACHTVLMKCGFVEKLSPKGFSAHGWNEHNAKLLANWENGKNGGRPKKIEIANEINGIEKPVGFVGLTQPEPIETIDKTDKREQMEITRTDVKVSQSFGLPSEGNGVHHAGFNPPTLEQVRDIMEKLVDPRAGRYAQAWLDGMEKQRWLDNNSQPVRAWSKLAIAYARACMAHAKRSSV